MSRTSFAARPAYLSTMKDHETTTRSRELGGELRRIREQAGYNATQLASLLGWSPSRISCLESGKRGASEVDVATFIAYCQVSGPKRDRLLTLARQAYDRIWLQSHGGALPDELRTLILHEATASTIHVYDPLVVPGLLQTQNYARTVFRRAGLVSEDIIEPRVQARIDRQSLLQRREPPSTTFYLHEQALLLPIDDQQIMNEQLLHLALVSGRPSCSIRVVPASAGPQGGLGGPFRLMEYVEHGPVVYVANQTTSLFLEDKEHIAAYQVILDRLAEVALDREESRQLLVRLANEYDQPEEGSDDHD
jgi:transcriptional regulator with XRE-family HTH domain